MKNVLIEKDQFKDAQGRTLVLRGVNLGGSAKVPSSPNGASHLREGFDKDRAISFVGRPFPLAEADEHFNRLRKWGFNFLRLLVTWEAIEHGGPGQYDEEYLRYLYHLVKKAGEYGFNLVIDPHQDVWSRFSGGDGAPRWTLEKVGFDVTRFSDTGAALIHHPHGDPFPPMVWPTNYFKLASATMFTLFFAGNELAPLTRIEGQSAQDFLQSHYLRAIRQVAERLKELPNVIGFGALNEPSAGWIGWIDLNDNKSLLRLGASPTPLQSMALGDGIAQEVEQWHVGLMGAKKTGKVTWNTAGVKVWKAGYDCPWKRHGVWDVDSAGKPRLLRPDHFTEVNGRNVEFGSDYFIPFVRKFKETIRSVDPELAVFVESPIGMRLPSFGAEDAASLVHAGHWYDVITLFTKHYRTHLSVDPLTGRMVLGKNRIHRLFVEQLARLKEESRVHLHNAPTLIGEFGIPFDMRSRKAYRTNDFSLQTKALDASFQAIEANLLSATIWNYTPDNTNERGDQWNGEDLSIFSRDQQTNPQDINSGGRALRGFVRPYPTKVAGTPMKMYFDMEYRIFEFEFRHDPAVTEPTEFYIPDLRYEPEYTVEHSDGTTERNLDKQQLVWRHDPEVALHWIKIYC